MKYFEKYKTVDERAKALRVFCNSNKTCKRCTLYDAIDDVRNCAFHWLELEAKEEEKPLPCPFCGDKGMVDLVKLNNPRESFVRCARCFYSSPRCDRSDEAVAAHNRLCRAVMAAKESEARDGE